ncbi:DUF4405 domain-containing protein [Clostridium algoriphilum]|uniref:DUF4405 domain-containing protein n=1 Tax=Clostridium algoriphilum TaxID=198347 RepID=UPI001CF1AD24|nr:DUF4405 domain-containing protein [Clostridium algoriphilum]MCB2293990.1 DUF4405 domain-containing protein [Clostridium algoriphilum]
MNIKKLNYLKIVLDTLMAVVFVLLFNYKMLGMLFHEVAGLAIGAVILLHCGLNWKWIKGVSLKICNSKLPTKTRIGYSINILLLLNVIIIIISGIFISKTLFPGLALSGGKSLQSLHITLSYCSLLLIGIHIGLHWNWVMITFRKIFKITEKKKIYSHFSKILVVLLLSFGIYSTYSVKFVSKISITPIISSLTSTSSSTSPSSGGNEIKKGNSRPMKGPSGSKPTQGSNGSPQGNHKPNGSGSTNTSILGVITSYLSVISLFSIITFYIEKLLTRRKKKMDEKSSLDML